MHEPAHYTDASFQTIKQGLDPDFSYIVFERTVIQEDDASFDDVFDILSSLQGPDTAWHIYTDKIERMLRLVIKMMPEHAENVMNKVLETALKNDLKYYYYRNRFQTIGDRPGTGHPAGGPLPGRTEFRAESKGAERSDRDY